MSLLDSLRRHEGLRLTVYDDATGKPIQRGSQVVGNPTIGIGTLIAAPGGITEAEATLLLSNRVQVATAAADALTPGLRERDPVRADVLAEMAFQMGGNGLANFKNTLAAVRAGEWGAAADGMLASAWARQTPARAQALAQTMRSGVA